MKKFIQNLEGIASRAFARFPAGASLFVILVGSLVNPSLSDAQGTTLTISRAELAVKTREMLNEYEPFGTLPVAADRAATNSIVVTVSAYNSVPAQTDSTPCIGAQGTNICAFLEAGSNTCAANFVPLGTKLHVEGLGVCVVRDRMNARYTHRVDWYMGQDIASAKQWGIRKKTVGIYSS
ncbi:MAG: hypothetical protein WCT24_00220 [Patescibacteria group bacterium]